MSLAASGLAVGASPPLSEEDLTVFLDGFFERELAAHQVVGAAVAVVRDGRLVVIQAV